MYYVIGGSHSTEVRHQLMKAYPLTPFFKYTECKVYACLTHEEAKLLAWDHNNDNDYRKKMSCIGASGSSITSTLMRFENMVHD